MKQSISDPVIKELVKQFGELPDISVSNDLFEDVVSSVVGQQLSIKAADTIWKRFITLFPTEKVVASEVVTLQTEDIRKQGISYPKIKYIKGIAQAVLDGTLIFEQLHTRTDQEIIEELTKLKGVGTWTAEMILIFSLGRPDVFSLGDLGLRNAVSKLYGIDRDDLVQIKKISETWSPHRSLVSRYLWKSLDNTPKNS